MTTAKRKATAVQTASPPAIQRSQGCPSSAVAPANVTMRSQCFTQRQEACDAPFPVDPESSTSPRDPNGPAGPPLRRRHESGEAAENRVQCLRDRLADFLVHLDGPADRVADVVPRSAMAT